MLLILLLLCLTLSQAEVPENGWYQVKHSFKPPYETGFGGYSSQWKTYGSAMVTDRFVQLTPNDKSKAGGIWNQKPHKVRDWEVHLKVVIGGGNVMGADGMAFWYISKPGSEGPVFGGSQGWTGLGIFFDTFDNDGLSDFPIVYGVVGDGTQEFLHSDDGLPSRFGSCVTPFRTSYYENQHFHPSHFIIRHVDGILSLSFDTNSLLGGEPEWHLCFSQSVQLPDMGYFGLSAATGGISDHHDVISFITYSIVKDVKQLDYAPMEPPKKLDWQNTSIPKLSSSDIPDRLFVIQNREYELTSQMNNRFDSLKERLLLLEKHTVSHLEDLVTTMSHLSTQIESGKSITEVYERDISDLSDAILVLQNKLNSLNNQVDGIIYFFFYPVFFTISRFHLPIHETKTLTCTHTQRRIQNPGG
eukprot:TRINITY_DN2251_c0_g3_i7.p1 TRINITY_DN2251_c0_g3~~TRINITY_DN2251_c0_g3_i7.p1  ORF type:complete len:415 (-),score=71.40 TRINITY_DN2251_c0_g3_i7:210-1454(-)